MNLLDVFCRFKKRRAYFRRMKKRFYVNKFVVIANLLIWFLYITMSAPYLFGGSQEGITYPIPAFLLNIVVTLSIFYACYYHINPYFLQRDAYFQWTLTLLALIIAVVFTRHVLDRVVYTGLYLNGQPFRPISLRFINSMLVVLVTGVFSFLEISEARKQAALKKENLRLAAELGFLQSQINPHFLFNTLNNIYSFAYRKDDRAPAMITKLSEIIRYLLYECRTKRVSLQKEMALIQNYLELESLRNDAVQNIDFYAEGIEEHHHIAPLILITFVENCFKHSDIQHNEKAWMTLHFEMDEAQVFHAEFANSRVGNTETKAENTAKSSGLGMGNAKQQLALNYPNRHELAVESTPHSYTVKLNCRL
jgi:two-component system, LytTR family, sensor kinase